MIKDYNITKHITIFDNIKNLIMKNVLTIVGLALCLGIFSFTVLNDPMKDQPLIHTVFFWLDEDLTTEEIAVFEQALRDLGTVPSIDQFYWGPPASTEKRDVVENSYSYAINVHFKSLEAQKTYQDHPIHKEFLKQASKWTKVIVFDNAIAD